MKQTILNLRQENGTLSMIIQQRNIGNEIMLNTKVLKSNLCDYNNAYILVRAALATQVAFKNCAPFTKCITNIDGTTIDDA